MEANPDAPPESRGGRLSLDVEHLAQNNTSPDKWKVTLRIAVDDEEERTPPYSVELRLTGFFRYTGQLDSQGDAEVAQLVLVNGGSVIFSAAREHIWLATSRGPWGSFSLPTLDIRDLVVDIPSGDQGNGMSSSAGSEA